MYKSTESFKKICQRVLSLALTFALVFAMLPVFTLPAHAAGPEILVSLTRTTATAAESGNKFSADSGVFASVAELTAWDNDSQITIGGTGRTPIVINSAALELAPYNGWKAASEYGLDNATAFQVKFSTLGYAGITFSASQKSTGTGPDTYKLAYRIGSAGPFIPIASSDVTPPRLSNDSYDALEPTYDNFALPDAVNNKSEVYLRVYFDGINDLGRNGNTSINDILIKGSPLFSGGTGTSGDPYIITTAAGLNAIRDGLAAHYKLGNDIDLDLAPYNTGAGWEPIGIDPFDPFTGTFTGTFDGAGYTVSGLYIDRSTEDYVGLFGVVGSSGTVINLKVEGSVTGKDDVGGVAGRATGGTISNCYNTGAVSGNENVGGVAGRANASTIISDCYNTGSVSGKDNVGGVVGRILAGGKVTDCYNTGSVSGNGYAVGGVAGHNVGTVSNCVSLGLTVLGTGYIGRVTGSNSGTLTDNQARADMKIGASGSQAVAAADIGADETNGADVALGTALSAVFSGWDTWNIPAGDLIIGGALPTLKGFSGSQNPVLPGVVADTAISIAAIPGVTAPVANATPVTAITETVQYTGTVTWSPSSGTFGYSTIYTAEITLTPKTGYTLTGVTADFFTVAGATSVSNTADSGVITAEFPATGADPAIADDADISAAKGLVEGAFPSSVAQANIADEAAALARINTVIGGLALNGVSHAVTKVSYTAAVAGTDENPGGTDGSYTFTVNLDKGSGTQQTTITLTLTITATAYEALPSGTSPDITTTSLPDGTAGTAYSQTLSATGDAPITWTVDSGTLPPGLALAANGTMSGTPTAEGTSTFSVKASNAAGDATKPFSITVTGAPGGESGGEGGGQPSGGSGSPGGGSNASTSEKNYGVSPQAPSLWAAVNAQVNAKQAASADAVMNHVVMTGRNIIVPVSVLANIQDGNVALLMNTGLGVTFSITGSNEPDSLGNARPLDLTVRTGGISAPGPLVQEKTAGTAASIQVPMAKQESFGRIVNMHFNFGAGNAGHFANLYRYDPASGKMEYLGSCRINEKGQALFGISAGADYLVTVSGRMPNEIVAPSGGISGSPDADFYVVASGDTMSRIAARNGTGLRQLSALNPEITDINRIRPGQRIRLR